MGLRRSLRRHPVLAAVLAVVFAAIVFSVYSTRLGKGETFDQDGSIFPTQTQSR